MSFLRRSVKISSGLWRISWEGPTMNEILNHLEPWEVVVVTAIVAGAWVLLGLGSAWRQVREKQARASLVQELLRQGRPVEEVERLLWATSDLSQPPPTDEQALVSLAEALTQMGVSGAAIGEIMAATRAAD